MEVWKIFLALKKFLEKFLNSILDIFFKGIASVEKILKVNIIYISKAESLKRMPILEVIFRNSSLGKFLRRISTFGSWKFFKGTTSIEKFLKKMSSLGEKRELTALSKFYSEF